MNEEEMNYLAEGLEEVYREVSFGTKFYLVPLLKNGFTENGTPNLIFDEENKKEIVAAYHSYEESDSDLEVSTTRKDNREYGLIQVCLWGKDFKIKDRDAIDFECNGETVRYVVLGLANGVAMPQLYNAYRVTTLKNFMLFYMGE